ncbi:MAG TPA: choice-of-anchor Q domain-containing protein, partial [Chitinophagaceae bacterium]|nr:choice-of-anchor Q domain-containing protein [Chitinophagaceae bacterium]
MRKLFVLLLFFCSINVFAKTLHVKTTFSGLNNGTSWVNAFFNLQAAIDSAKNGDTIKVAAGLYRPSAGFFELKNGVIFLAGYSPSTGDTTDAARNWINFPVILTATLMNGSSIDSLVVAKNVSALTVMDGFFIRDARTYGLRILNSSNVFLRNIIVEGNFQNAVGIYNSSADFRNCVFSNNFYGRTLNNEVGSTSNFYNCVFTGNTAASTNEPIILNTSATVTLINCTVVSNVGIAFNGVGTGSATIRNCIFWNNKNNNRIENCDIVSPLQPLQVSHSITQTYYDTSVNSLLVSIHPRFVNILNPAGPDNKYFTADDGLQLSIPCSPALNVGDNIAASILTTDILGQPRFFNTGIVDIGAYERQNVPGSFLRIAYVKNSNNTGNNDGSSWQNAFKTLQEALLYCADTIKVAVGTYLTSNSFVDSIFFVENKKVLLGGYPASGNPVDADRNPNTNLTILKGNYSGTSTGIFSPVVKSYYNDSTTIVDGFAFTNDAASPGGSPNVNALRIDYRSGIKIRNCNFTVNAAQGLNSAGISIENSYPTIFRTAFNCYMTSGGGIAISCGNSNPNISFCSFTAEFSNTLRSGTAISAGNSTLNIDSCIFWKLSHSVGGSFISSNNCSLNISRCLFRNNGNDGVPMMNTNNTGTISKSVFRNFGNFSTMSASIYNNNSNPVIAHCLFDSLANIVTAVHIENINRSAPVFNNCVAINGRFMKNKLSSPVVNNSTIINTYIGNIVGTNPSEEELINNDDSTTLRANNTIFWTNKPAPGKQEILNQNLSGISSHTSTSVLTNCLTRVYGTDGVNGNRVGQLPRFYQLDDINGPDNLMFTADDGIRLARCSPAINAGNNSIGSLLSTDILEQPRIFSSVVDIGAYELQEAPDAANSFYVNSTATGTNSGRNWQNAYKDLQSAVCNACADTIRVAMGVYKPAVSSRDSTFYIDRPITLLGGYPNSGDPIDQQRNPEDLPTIISGNIGNPLDSLDNSGNLFVIVGTKDSVIIDGFTIRDGNNAHGGITFNGAGGAGIYSYYNHTVINRCQFLNNVATPYGGAIYTAPRTTCRITRSIFINNSSTNSGGAIRNADALNISDCVFEGNNSWGEGGAIRFAGGELRNTVFYNNYTTATNSAGQGGAVWAMQAGVSEIINCTFFENKTNSNVAGGGGLAAPDLSLRVRNCIFKGNSVNGSLTSSQSDMIWAGYNTVFKTMLQVPRMFTQPSNIIYDPPAFKDSLNPKGPDGKWMTADDGLQLNYYSAAINFGDNNVVASVPLDILLNTRIINGTVDLGPYEYQDLPVANAGVDTAICPGSTIQIGKAGNNPAHTYSWTSAPSGFTSNSMTPTVNPTVITSYYLEVSNGTSIARDTIIVKPSATVTPAVSITTPLTTICQGISVTFSATPLHGGTTPSYQWQVNGVNAGTNQSTFTTSTLVNNDQVKVILTSNAGCANPVTVTSNFVTVTITPSVTPSVTITSVPANTFCPNETVTFTATALNGGPVTYYRWIHGTINFGSVLQNGVSNTYSTNYAPYLDGILVQITSTAACATPLTAISNSIVMTPAPSVTPFVSIVASKNNICPGENVTFTATPVNGGTTPSYQWKVNGVNVGTNSNTYSTNTLVNNDQVSVVMTTSLTCVTATTYNSSVIFMTVRPSITPSISINGTVVVNAGNATNITSAINNGGGNPGYQWQDSTDTHSWQNIPGATSAQLNYTPAATGNKLRCMLASSVACASPAIVTSNALTFTVNLTTA